MNVSSAAMKVILLTGASDGIGLETAKMLLSQGHQLLLHGRNPTKLDKVVQELQTTCAVGTDDDTKKKIDTFVADLSVLEEVESMAQSVLNKYDKIDVLINNAGVFKTSNTVTKDGLDTRFAVNTIAPYLLTKRLLPIIPPKSGRVVNVSSAASQKVDLEALAGRNPYPLSDFAAYSQSKLGITMWNYALSQQNPDHLMVSVNPASMLGSKMVREGWGVAGKDLSIGATILQQLATSKKYGDIGRVSGRYFDNDSGRFQPPDSDGTNMVKCQALIDAMESIIEEKLN